MNKIPGHPLTQEEFAAAAFGERDAVTDETGMVVGYYTWFSGMYVCLTCGHMCECYDYEEEEEEEEELSWQRVAIEMKLALKDYKRGEQ